MNPILEKLTGLFAGKGADLVNSVKGLIDESKFSAEEKAEFEAKALALAQQHEVEMAKLAQSEVEATLKDVADARDANVHIQESDKASWMAKNIAYCIDAFVILLWGVLTLYLIGSALKMIKTTQVDLTGIYGLYAAVTGVAMTIINFHRGSSVGSKTSGETLRKIASAK